jgi:flagellar motor switch protein FliG
MSTTLGRISGTQQEQFDDPGTRKAAIAILALGAELAREIFAILDDREIQRIIRCAEQLRGVSAQEVHDVLEELCAGFEEQVVGVAGHERMLHDAAEQAIGRERLSRMLGEDGERDAIRKQLTEAAGRDPQAFAQVMAKEHPQTVAVVFALVDPEVGSRVLGLLPERMRADVVRRVATMKNVPTGRLMDIAEAIGRELKPTAQEAEPMQIDGTERVVALLKATDSGTETGIFDVLTQTHSALAQEIKRRMFVFEDLLQLQSREIQLILRQVDSQTLTLALKTASSALQEHIFANMSSRAAEMILDDLQAMGPVTVAQVEKAQDEIVQAVIQLAAEGKINMRPGETV